jgi:spore germination cell wall hydrolase CwlJ-like protein
MSVLGKIMLFMSISDADIVTSCLVLEESRTDGMTAIMCVINNRAGGDHKKYRDVVLKKYQFSCMNEHTVHGKSLKEIVKRAKSRSNWNTARGIVMAAMRGMLDDTSEGATHYHVYVGKSKCTPFWTHPSLGGSNQKCKITKRIGTHVFLKDVD